jgi:hypothetical protein
MMATIDQTKPYISMERNEKTGVHAIHLVIPNGSRADVVVNRSDGNAAALEYFYEKLKDGMNI